MNLEMYATEVVTTVFIGLVVPLMATAFYCSRKRAETLTTIKTEQNKAKKAEQTRPKKAKKAQVEKAQADMVKALQYETLERVCVGMACALVAVALLNINHSTIVNGLCVIIQKLEVLAHG